MFDLKEFADNVAAQERGQEFELLRVNGEGSGVFLTIYGMDSTRYREGMSRFREKLAKEQGMLDRDEEQSLKDDAYAFSWIVGGWRTVWKRPKDGVETEQADDPVIVINGERMAFSRENAEIMLAVAPAIRDQVVARARNRAGFTAA